MTQIDEKAWKIVCAEYWYMHDEDKDLRAFVLSYLAARAAPEPSADGEPDIDASISGVVLTVTQEKQHPDEVPGKRLWHLGKWWIPEDTHQPDGMPIDELVDELAHDVEFRDAVFKTDEAYFHLLAHVAVQRLRPYLRQLKREIVDWKPGTDRSMDMWNKLPDDPIQHSMPLVFKTTITYGDGNTQTHLWLGYYDGNVNAFIESGMPDQHYRESVDCWYQFPIPPEQGRPG